MNKKNRNLERGYSIPAALFIAIFAFILSSCGNDNVELSGSVVMGPVDGATVIVYALETDGSTGGELARTQTESNGTFSVSGPFEGPVRFVVTGGSYYDEATGDQVELQERHQLESWVGDPQNQAHVGINALTTMAARYAYQYAHRHAYQNGYTHEWLKETSSGANNQVSEMFGLRNMNLLGLHPANLTEGEEEVDPNSGEAKLGAILAAFTQVANDNGLSSDEVLDLLEDVATDYSDGSFDGVDADGAALESDLSITPEQAMNSFEQALENFLAGPRNASGITMEQLQLQFRFQNNE